MSTPYEQMKSGEIYWPSDTSLMEQQFDCLEKLYDFNATRPHEQGKRQALLKGILDIQNSTAQGLLGVEKMAGKGHQLVKILLAENLGNPGLLSLRCQFGARAGGQQDNRRHRNQAIAAQASAQRQTVAVAQLPGNNHEIKGLPGRFAHSLGRRGEQREVDTTKTIEALLKNLPIKLGTLNYQNVHKSTFFGKPNSNNSTCEWETHCFGKLAPPLCLSPRACRRTPARSRHAPPRAAFRLSLTGEIGENSGL